MSTAGEGGPSAARRRRDACVPLRLATTLVVVLVLAGVARPRPLLGQTGPLLQGRVLLGDGPLPGGTIVLHEITDSTQGQVDSVTAGPDGRFELRLPATPDRSANRFYFGSVRHQGITYFGNALERPAQLDSIYEIRTWDTLVAAGDADVLAIQARNLFYEPDGGAWRVTDIFQLRNDTGRTVVGPEEGAPAWRYPLPPGARDFTSGQGGFSFDATMFENDTVSVRTAIAPGERIVVFHYTLDEPWGTVPTPGVTEALDLLVREPSPRVGVEGLELVERVEVEAGSTYRRYSGENVGPGTVRLVEQELPGDVPYAWITAVMGLALAVAAALVVARRPAGPATAGGPSPAAARGRVGPARAGRGKGRAEAERERILLEIARLDEEFEARASPTDAERAAYRARREKLLGRLRGRRS